MKDLVKFFIEVGKLRKIKRRGWVLIGAKEPATVVDHTFRMAMMAWILAGEKKSKINIERVLKIALIHDICELYAGDMTPYDFHSILPEDKKKWSELFDKWPRPSKSKKMKGHLDKHKKEKESLMKVISTLPPNLKKEIFNLWMDYEKGLTPEGRFVKQTNRLETLLQALEYGEENKREPYKSWWIGTEEMVDDPILLQLMEVLVAEFYKKPKTKS